MSQSSSSLPVRPSPPGLSLPLRDAASAHRLAAGERRRVVVAMSGGVDSSVVAGLLARQGHDVVGVTLQLYDHGAATGAKGTCCAGQDVHDARRAADALAIPHYVLDYEQRFRGAVIDAFADAYIAGETPVPCVACNSRIKFTDLLDTARELGAEALATGHYVERRDGAGGPEMFRGVDAERDQSYFLFATTRDQLSRLWFPLGGLRKEEVRRLALDLGLAVAAKPDSQDICFVPSGRYADVIQKLRPDAVAPGEIVDMAGRVVGHHQGIINFTVGQRRGLGIAGPEPLYVLRLDAARRQVVVGPRAALATHRLALRDFNWLGEGDAPAPGSPPLPVHARVRSSRPPQEALLQCDGDGGFVVELPSGEYGVAAGQACVLYASGEARARVLGGGIIRAGVPRS